MRDRVTFPEGLPEGLSYGEDTGAPRCDADRGSEHGGNIYRFAEEAGIPSEEVLDFSASINPLGVPRSVVSEIRRVAPGLRHYPDPEAKSFRMEVSRQYDIDPETIVCGNGSTETIYLVTRALMPERVLIPAPTFSEYERACRCSGAEVKQYELTREQDFDIDPEAFTSAMRGCDMAFLCNPNNPTGRLVAKRDLHVMAEAAKEQRCCLIVDEAFIDFCPAGSLVREVQRNPYLIVIRSLTKFYALSGLRLGYGVFPAPLIHRIKGFKEPWTVNTLAQGAGVVALNDHEYRSKTVAVIARERAFLEGEFRKRGITYLPSAVNYYLLRIEKAQDIVASLREKAILVRDCSNFTGLDGSYVRVAVRSRRENKRLIGELARLCEAR